MSLVDEYGPRGTDGPRSGRDLSDPDISSDPRGGRSQKMVGDDTIDSHSSIKASHQGSGSSGGGRGTLNMY